MVIQAQKGTVDILPEDIETWHKIEEIGKEVFTQANFKEIRTPIFEATELFARGVGDSTDIVNKEMYTFDMNGRSLTLRPENTAGVVRAYIQNGFHKVSPPVKLWYKGSMFRYERPQAGRQRQFNQIGVEMFGVSTPLADAECINLAVTFLNKLGLNDLEVEINSLGCKSCRDLYRNKLKEVLKVNLENLCEDCKVRYEKNPLRILDCKNEKCNEILSSKEIQDVINADYICDECKSHYEDLKKYLTVLGIKFKENKQLVRGLDYYNRTVFEIKSNNLGSQNAVCGGGRYDGLIEMLGGQPTPGIGWAMGMERLCALINKVEPKKADYFVVSNFADETLKLVKKLRAENLSVDYDYTNKKFGKQLEKASKIAKNAIILGEDEINAGTLTVKNLETGEQKNISEQSFFANL